MKNNLIKFYSTSFCLLTRFMLFALPGDGSDDPGFENPETPASPIDSQIFILAVVGILFAVYIFRNNRKTI